ncbi:2'-5' RNA ligase superfamily protein [Roseimicrobium gellanilyticum]|uniref:2'-5' RNA ligase superfamily protein n=1 Tax=Roseimicrobium gellanilyticum TaxID=748857 RepID=A0A366H5M6_9BACT|nr:2'-5' RNA ligase family protein [Roseimicrobium gellanilyticum]RBP37263.1 2'-5' RNA ligase superfamily protein [Roseimicrobium gellanilyticum]
MPYAVEMYFDEPGTARIREMWDRLSSIGFSSMNDCGARPHVSLAVCEQLELSTAPAIVDDFSGGVPPFELSFSSYGLFPGAECVLFLAPKVTSLMLEKHARFHEVISTATDGMWAHYTPGQWVPHCTLARAFSI